LNNRFFIIITISSILIIFLVSIGLQYSEKGDKNIVVEKIMSQCHNDVECIIEYLGDPSYTENSSIVLASLDGILEFYQNSTYYCHPEAHHLGMFLYDYLGDLPQALSIADQRCGGSLYHGIIQKFFMREFLNGINPNNIDLQQICPTNNEEEYSLERWQCLHGVGHGLTYAYNYDVFSAVSRCEEFDQRIDELSCSKGVFMEHVGKFHKLQGKSFDDVDLFFPCNSVDEKFAAPCYHYQTHYLLIKLKSEEKVFAECDKIQPTKFVQHCYYGMGRTAAGKALQKIEDGIEFCKIGRVDYQSYCFTGLLLTLVNNGGVDKGFEYCKFISPEFKKDCYDGLGKWILLLYSNESDRVSKCTQAESREYSKICTEASLGGIVLL